MIQLEVDQVAITIGSHMNNSGNFVSIYPLLNSTVSYFVSSHYCHEDFQMLFALFKLIYKQ